METVNFTASKTGVVGNVQTSVSTDELGTTTVYTSTSNAAKLSVQVAGGGGYTVVPSISNDGINFVPYTRSIDESGAAAATFVGDGLYMRPEGDHFAYMQFAITGIDDDFLLTVRGLN